jgi:hypothetical protein
MGFSPPRSSQGRQRIGYPNRARSASCGMGSGAGPAPSPSPDSARSGAAHRRYAAADLRRPGPLRLARANHNSRGERNHDQRRRRQRRLIPAQELPRPVAPPVALCHHRKPIAVTGEVIPQLRHVGTSSVRLLLQSRHNDVVQLTFQLAARAADPHGAKVVELIYFGGLFGWFSDRNVPRTK